MDKLLKGNKRPWIIGGIIVVGAIILWSLIGGSKSSASTVVTSGPSEALQAANLQASTMLAAQQMDAQGQIAIATLQHNAQAMALEAQLKSVEHQSQIQLAGLGAEERLGMASIGAAERQAALQHSTQLEMMQMQGEMQMYYDSQAAAIELARIDANVATAQYGLAAQVALGEQAAAVSQGQTAAMVAMAQYQAELAAMQTQAATHVELSRIDANKEIEFAQSRERTKGQSKSLLGSVVGGVLGLFSEPGMKTKIVQRGGADEHGLNNYSFEYARGVPSAPWREQVGLMAPEVQEMRPDLIIPTPRGRMVNYNGLEYKGAQLV